MDFINRHNGMYFLIGSQQFKLMECQVENIEFDAW